MASRLAGSGSSAGWVILAVTGAWTCALLSADALGCSSTTEVPFALSGNDSGGGPPPSSDSGPTSMLPPPSGDAGVFIPPTDDGGGGGGDGDCPPSAGKYIFVVDDQNVLYTFDPTMVPTAAAPTNNPFTSLGPLNCPGETTPPPDDNSGVNSMAVDRQAVAWVNFSDGKIFNVDTTQASLPCTDTGFVPGQGGFTAPLGMGFVTVSATNHNENLYVSDNGGPGGTCPSMATTPGPGCTGLGLGLINTQTMTMTPTGAWGSSLAGYNAELSGTGGGILYGFFTTTPSDLATIDTGSGNVSSIIPLPSVDNSIGGYAFSFWGGDFWIYTAYPTATDPNATTSVTHYVSADGGIGVPMKDIGFTIVGAGSSTCVPTIPPPPPK
jgi:hypothetical protein